MTRYRKKPVEVEAWQVGSDEPMPEWLMRAVNKKMIRLQAEKSELVYVVRTPRAEFKAKNHDYIIDMRSTPTMLDVLPPEHFEQTYEVVE